MDEKSLHTLEFDKIRRRLAEYTSFSGGRELALALTPTDHRPEAQRWQAETSEARRLRDARTDVRIGGARDVRPAVDNAQRGFTLPAEDLLEIRATLIAARTLQRQLEKATDEFPHLAAIGDLIEECPGLVSTISETLDERGEVLDSASTRLANIRKELRVTHGRIQDKLQSLLNSSMNQYLQEPLITMRSGRYVVPLKADNKGRIKGIVHDQSGSGATLWIEPYNTIELNNQYRSLQIEERDEIERILAELSADVALHGDAIRRIVARLAELDLIFARADYANATDAVEPELVEWRTFPQPRPPKHANERANWTPPPPNLHPGSVIWIKGARHPLLDPDTVVPTDLTLDEATYLVLITGPNTGGKTVSLKTMGLMALMAQSGLHLPVVEARLTVFDDIFADIGDEQSIEQSLSTFSAHITNIIHILARADGRSLVLLDELGSGTDPAEGAALAQSMVSYLRDQGVTTFVATHYPELKAYASQTRGATNASLLFDIDTLSPTYEMTIGLPGRSNAVAIARRLGLDETILDEALALIGAGSNKAESMLESIYDLREKITAQEAAARLALRDARQHESELEQRLAAIETEREQILAEAHEEARAELADFQDEIRQLRRRVRSGEAGISLNTLKQINKEASQIEEEQLAQARPEPKRRVRRRDFEEGDAVLVKSLNTEGTILTLSKREAEVAVGRLHMRVELADLELREREEAEEVVQSDGVSSYGAIESPGMELDLRGQRVEEGLTSLERYLDSAFLAHLPWVRIIHGKGTGRMREAVRGALKKSRYVQSWEEGKDGEGGAGVTVAKLSGE